MARLRRAGHEDSVLDGVSPASLSDFGLIPSPLGGEGQGEGWVTALPGECCPTCEWHGFAAQDTRTPSSTGFRRRCAAWRVTFLCVAKEKSPKERPPPLVRPPASGSLGSGKRSGGTTQTVHPCTACFCAVVHDGAPDLLLSPRRTTGATSNTQPRGWLTASGVFEAVIGRDVISDPALRPPRGEIRLSHLCSMYHQYVP